MRWSIDLFEGYLIRKVNSDDASVIMREFPKVYYYEPSEKKDSNAKFVRRADIDILSGCQALFGYESSAKWVSDLKWWIPYLHRFGVSFWNNQSDFEMLLDSAPWELALKIAQHVGFNGCVDDLRQVRLLVNSMFSAAMYVFSFVDDLAVKRIAASFTPDKVECFVASRSIKQLKKGL